MTNNNIEAEIKLIITLACIIGFICAISLYKKKDYRIESKEICINNRSTIFVGKIVEEKYSRGVYYLTIDGKKFYTWCKETIINIKIGDSIVKPANTFDIYIYKQANPDSVIFVPCDFDCDIYMKQDSINRLKPNN